MKRSEIKDFLSISALFIGVSMVLGAIIVVPRKANDTSLIGSLEGLMGIFNGILGIVLIVAGAVYIYGTRKNNKS